MKKKILIQTTEYFSTESWESSFEKFYPDYKERIEIFYFCSQLKDFNKLAINCEYCFIIQYVDGMNMENSKLKLVYIGVSNIDFSDQYKFPDQIKILSLKGLAKELIAEYTVMAALSLTRQYHISFLNKSKKKWDQKPFLIKGFFH